VVDLDGYNVVSFNQYARFDGQKFFKGTLTEEAVLLLSEDFAEQSRGCNADQRVGSCPLPYSGKMLSVIIDTGSKSVTISMV
jgi:hypothetical protein